LLKKKQFNKLIAYYQDMLKNFNQNPREENWQKIEAQLKEEKSHENIRSKFDGFAPTPNAGNWDQIQSKLDQPSQVKVNYAVRIAASICFIILALTFTSDSKEVLFSELFVDIDNSSMPYFNLCEDPEIIALDIVKPVLKKTKVRKKKSKAKSKQKRLLDIILAEDDDIKVDSALIAELIRPVDILSEEDMFATVGGSFLYYREGDDFKKMYYLPEIDYHLEIPADTSDAVIYKAITP